MLKAILQQIRSDTDSDLTAGKYFNQLRVLAQLRNLIFRIDDMLDSISTFFKEEKDPFYIRGQKKTEEKKNREFVTNLIEKLGLSDKQAADIANVPIQFVKEIRSSLKK